MNNRRAWVAGTRLLVRCARLKDALKRIKTSVRAVVVGNHHDSATSIGPLVSRAQFDRVQHFIRCGQEEGATIVIGGPSESRKATSFGKRYLLK